ncbi:2-phospho-L-lactate guanylyltransferase [Streptomyces sp. NPDC051954]|uniref:2-phospho-L-lactate guanylyltransferase n=1 Tax=Streptomyces sp. NPDC051954 TaxID=3155524 RepID=UPI003449138E
MPETWTVVLPVKPFHQAKSRLAGWRSASRQDLAHAFFRDTLDAVRDTTGVGRVLVVTNDPQAAAEAALLGAMTVIDHPRSGLNAAVRRAICQMRALAENGPIAVLTTDLPALRSAELGHVLAEAALHEKAFLADRTGQGTTLLAAALPQWLTPSFEGNSAHRHRLDDAHEITGLDVPSVRLDVDTLDDLHLARQLGVGRHTQDALTLALQTRWHPRHAREDHSP